MCYYFFYFKVSNMGFYEKVLTLFYETSARILKDEDVPVCMVRGLVSFHDKAANLSDDPPELMIYETIF